VIPRGIERREIFGDDRDRQTFVEKLAELVNASGARVYVLRSGDQPLR